MRVRFLEEAEGEMYEDAAFCEGRTEDLGDRFLEYSARAHTYQADLYRPGQPPLASIVLVPGVAEAGKDDPRLVAFATTLARSRFTVLIPDLSELRALKISAANVDGVVAAFRYLASRADLYPPGKAGIGAFSYAVGPAILAALETELRGQVAFVLCVGGYYDLRNVLTFLTTGYFLDGKRWRFGTPLEQGKWLFVMSNLDRLADPADRDTMRTIAQRVLIDPDAPLGDLVPRLGPEGRSVYALVTNSDPERVPALLKDLPHSITAELSALTLANRDLRQLGARLILVHGREDKIIPYTESIALAERVSREKLILVRGLSHVDLQLGVLGRWGLLRAVEAVLAERAKE